MEVFLFEPQTYQRLYNCSFYDVDSIPVERRRNPFLGTLYSLVIYAMLRSQFRNQETYRLMIFLGIIHCLGLQACGLATGFFAIQGYVFCSSPTIIYFAGQLALATWCASAMTSLLLGFNRCCELYGGGLGQRIFGGYRFWIWISIPLIYLVYIFVFTPPVTFSSIQMTWLFDPHVDYYPDFGKTYYNRVHSLNNIILCSTESFLYATLIGLYWRATKSSSNEIKNAFKREKMIYIQVICVGVIHFTASSIYVFIQFVHTNVVITMAASTFYLLSQGFPSVIYLCVNRTVRNLVISRLGLRRRQLATILPSSDPRVAALSSSDVKP
ncbi:Protein CBR-SRT-29 [Aphelenchoides bicaudatus]|nr:Protein CBR-SRT-29 [Aphelenchoides bicaudatus]